jgi:hypothetical protein
VNKEVSDIFGVTFIGEYVEIICKASDDEQGKLIVRGYMLDIDDDYYYLGANPLEVNTAVKKDWAGLIAVTDDIDPAVEMLNDFDVEDTDEGH